MDRPWYEKVTVVPMLRVHDAIYQKANGRIGHRIHGVPSSLLLHTVGAKTGLPRTTSLSYTRDGDSYLVVASKGGNPRSPGWSHNLRAHPEAEVNVGRKRFPVTARVVRADDPDHARLWQIANTNNHNMYIRYQRRTSRRMPVIVLTPG